MLLGGEELDVAGGVGAKSEIVEPELAIFQCDEGAFQLDVVVADGANFKTRQNHADTELFPEMVVEGSATVNRNHWWRFALFHAIIIA